MKKLNFKILFSLILLAVLIQSCSKNKTSKGKYHINVEIDGLKDGIAHLANLDLNTNERVNVDSTEIKNGKFSFNGKIESPYLYSIFLNDSAKRFSLFLENSKFNIKGNINDLENLEIIGSREDSLFRAIGLDKIFTNRGGLEIASKYPDYVFGAFTAFYWMQFTEVGIDTITQTMENFTPEVKKSEYYKQAKTIYESIKRVSISQEAPDFSIPDIDANLTQLSDFRGKYVLIDFWASWCAPCRASNPTLVKVYDTFKSRNFEIVGVSVDKNRERWLKAIEADGLQWTNLSNLNGWDETATTYGVKAVPQNFLIDPNGIIIAKNIEADKMMEELDKILPKDLN